jgi:phenylpyruvate tautomerase PptA (4-oxalocrotonate tautomerase family)
MVYVRVHVLEDYLSAEQKKELGDKLIAAVAEAEGLVNSERHRQTSWVQYFELERENWYAPATIGDPTAFWQVDVVGPQEYLPTEKEARLAIEKVTEAIRTVAGDGVLPARGPWVHVYAVPKGHWGSDGAVPDFEVARAYFAAESTEEAARTLEGVP